MSDAAVNCKAKKLALLSIDSVAEWQCLYEIYSSKENKVALWKNTKKLKILGIKSVGNVFWTSGSNEGEFCDKLDVHTSCSSENMSAITLAANLWANRTSSDENRWHSFRYNTTASETTGILLTACNKTNFYVCEVLAYNIIFSLISS